MRAVLDTILKFVEASPNGCRWNRAVKDGLEVGA